MVLCIRLATLDEAPLVRELMRTAFAEYDRVLEVPSGALSETVEDVAKQMGLGGAVLTFDDDVPVGSGRFERHAGYLYIGRLSVPPAHRGRGTGGAMMDVLEDIGRSEGFAEAMLGVRAAIPRNVDMYLRRGYEIVATYPHPSGTELILDMVKKL